MTLPPDRGRRVASAGFTLLEMIIVLAVLGLVLGIVVSRGPMRSHALEVRAVVADVTRALRQARGAAIAGGAPVLVVVNGERRSVTIGGGKPMVLPAGLSVSASAGLGGRAVERPVELRFRPDGSSSGGGILLGDGQRRMLVAIDWLTGRVSVANAP